MTVQKASSRRNATRLRIENDLRDAPAMVRLALGRVLGAKVDGAEVTSAGRAGRRQGNISELTAIADLKPGGAQHLRAILRLVGDKMPASTMGTLHDMRFVIFDDDTRLLFATAYDGDWDTYIDDFATLVPEMMDLFFGNVVGWPGITDPSVKDFIAQAQLTAEAWYVAEPNLSVVQTRQAYAALRQLEALVDAVEQGSEKPVSQRSEAELRAAQERVERLLGDIEPLATSAGPDRR